MFSQEGEFHNYTLCLQFIGRLLYVYGDTDNINYIIHMKLTSILYL